MLLLAISSNATQSRLLQAVQGYLQQNGWVANLESVAVSAWLAMALKGAETIAPSQWVDTDPDCLRLWYTPGQYFNWSRVTFPALTNALNSALGVSDPKKRAQLYWKAQQIIMDEALEMPIHQNADLVVMSSKLTGVQAFAGGNEYFYTASLSQ